jgi:hypothetical protein
MTTELAIVSGKDFAITQTDITLLPELLSTNLGDLGDDGLREFDLIRTGIPAGGAQQWTIPDAGGEPLSVPELEGIIIFHGDRRAFWLKSFDETGGGVPPDCSSINGRQGLGIIRGEEGQDPKPRACKTCPMAQWGSGNPENPEDNSQACTQRKVVFIIRKGDILPMVIDLAPTSIGPFKQFAMQLTSRGIPFYGAIVGMGLRVEADGGPSGKIRYSVVNPRLISRLDDETTRVMRSVREAIEPYVNRVPVIQVTNDGGSTH